MSLELQQLVTAGRNASRPTTADRERVLAELQARLGLAAGISPAGNDVAAVPRAASRGLMVKVAGVTTLAIVVGSLAFVRFGSLGSAPAMEVTGSESTPTAPMTMTSKVGTATQKPVTPSASDSDHSLTDEATTVPTSPSKSSRPHDSLAAEVAILSRAQTALQSGHAQQALTILGEHERRFRNGILAEERTAARIQAYCALGRAAEAARLRGKLSPNSLHGDVIRDGCPVTPKQR